MFVQAAGSDAKDDNIVQEEVTADSALTAEEVAKKKETTQKSTEKEADRDASNTAAESKVETQAVFNKTDAAADVAENAAPQEDGADAAAKHTVKQLHVELKKRGLSVLGSKQELEARLTEAKQNDDATEVTQAQALLLMIVH